MVATKALITGYYRYTDIQFEYAKAIPSPQAQSALKAFLSPDSLVHPSNPLHPGTQGIQLWVAILPGENGESRLCFSSQQVEYIRYWLHSMGLWEEMMPLPSSRYLLTRESVQSVSPALYPTASELKKAVRDISKNNKRVKTAGGTLTDLRANFERCRDAFLARKGTWAAVDFEAWERDHKVLTEFGYSLLTWDKEGKDVRERGHWTVEEHKNYRNGVYVTENRDHYLFGKSKELREKVFKADVADFIHKHVKPGPLFLIFHGGAGDKVWFELCGVPTASFTPTLPPKLPAPAATSPSPSTNGAAPSLPPIYTLDTAQLFKALEGSSTIERTLERMSALMRLGTTERLHNAGNDAHYTLRALESMASGPPLDTQRLERWPTKQVAAPVQGGPRPLGGGAGTGTNRLAVNWDEEDGSDWEDPEDIL